MFYLKQTKPSKLLYIFQISIPKIEISVFPQVTKIICRSFCFRWLIVLLLAMHTELYKRNKERHRFLGNGAEYQQHFFCRLGVKSGKFTKVLSKIAKVIPLEGMTNATKTVIFLLQPLSYKSCIAEVERLICLRANFQHN
jgi:hypothetical protein